MQNFMQELLARIKSSAEYIQKRINVQPEIGLILGSGLGDLADEIEDAVRLKYEDIPLFPVSRVEGHAGCLVIGKLNGKIVCAMQGRFHYYEGYSISEVTYGVRTMKLLGINKLIITNAAGGANKKFKPGDLMIITDHINNMGTNPLIGDNLDIFGPRFPDLTFAYDREYIKETLKIAKKIDIKVQTGVYCANTGPSYETPAEIKMMRRWGADAVGMSTVPEVIAAAHAGMRVLGITCITNMASGILDQELTHTEVMETSKRVKEKFKSLVKKVLEIM
ncbi:MAG TPA: purine-nucleoside phosphorylase [bacterium]|nr:purine-nucleoside phosphorylase [bacterium]